MREGIGLYRGKREDNGEWVEGYFCKKYFQEFPHDRYVIQYETKNDSKMWKPDYMVAEVAPETIGQFAFIDKNGKRAFEDDIVKYKMAYRFSHEDCNDADIVKEVVGVVKFSNGCFSPRPYASVCEDYWYSNGAYDFEVIGNIHDNPELLHNTEKI